MVRAHQQILPVLQKTARRRVQTEIKGNKEQLPVGDPVTKATVPEIRAHNQHIRQGSAHLAADEL